MKTKHYFNSNRVDEITERLEAKKNLRQEDMLYYIFVDHKKLTASEAWTKFRKPVPLTSIRRGMSNLQREGILLKTNETKKGMYGKPEHFYKLSQIKIEHPDDKAIRKIDEAISKL
ncbi:MAG: hypothetical protein Unbinned4585contig1001_5 [Prokaryotic dsDNA virus sp.]|nr:MAG: hypothetical protein Unbinned4585contig1001_5 [Prokaryotic dsDNA virus sp.]|tara:strand:+ start:1001 stop:1348 length:348 start_codon:yes stop_codon:yes gene_type:complete